MEDKRTLLDRLKKNWLKIYFLISLCLIVFVFGIVTGSKNLFPHDQLLQGWVAAEDWFANNNFKHYLGLRPEKFIHPSRHEGSGVTVYIPDKTQPGITLLTGMWDELNGINLIRPDGSLIHKWRVSFNDIWPNPPHVKKNAGTSDWDTAIHGVLLYPNGDILFNFEYRGLAKVDKCSNVVWKLSRVTHHSIYENAEKNLWVPARNFHEQPEKRFPLLHPPFTEEMLLKISPDGKVLREISILDVFFNSDMAYLLTANSRPQTRLTGHITHMNDIEILEKSMADQFPLFQAGDIMVSLRWLNMIIIIDSITEKIKWSMTGPYIRQHDPDFLPNGKISVFDNRSDGHEGSVFGGSRILSIDPVTRQVEVLYGSNSKNPFYTEIQGKSQHLPNGNILMSEPLAGRAFEVDSSGEIVWSYINRYDEDEVYRLTDAVRLDESFGNFAEEPVKCP